MSGAALNTDRELYREPKGDLPGDYYAASVHVTMDGHIGMNVGGTVVTLPIHEWHRRALTGMAEAWEKGYDAGDDDGYTTGIGAPPDRPHLNPYKATRPPVRQSAPLARAIAANRAAEAELDRLATGVEALADEWSGPESLRANAWVRERDAADLLRGALQAAASRIEPDGKEVEYAECTCGHYHTAHDEDGACLVVCCGCSDA